MFPYKQTCCNTVNGLPDLLTLMACGEYENLKVFLSACKQNCQRLPQDFLYVDSCSFGRVSVNAVDYCNENITIDTSDCQTCLSKTLHIDINQQPDFLMINWQDLLDMVNEYQNSCSGSDELLEFEFY